MRVPLKKLLPSRFHKLAGYAGRGVVRTLESAAPAGFVNIVPFDARGSAFIGGIVHVGPDLRPGGAERQLLVLTKAIAASTGLRQRFVGLHLNEDDSLRFFQPALEQAGVPVEVPPELTSAIDRLVAYYGEAGVEGLWSSLDWLPADVRSTVMRLAADFSMHRPSVVHGWQDAAGLAAGLAAVAVGVPRVIVAGRNRAPDRFTIYRPYMREAYCLLVKQPQVRMTNNSEAGALDYARWLGIDASIVKLVRNAVEPRTIDIVGARARWRRRFSLAEDTILIGGMFRLQEEKRPLTWIAVAAVLARRRPALRFVLFGAGTMAEAVRVRVAELGISMHLTMPGVAMDGAEAIAALDVLLHTSSEEGTPNVILEAAAVGVPSVVSAAGGSAEAIDPEITGTVVNELDPDKEVESLATACIGWLDDAARRDGVRFAGQRFMKDHFGVARLVAETLDLYK